MTPTRQAAIRKILRQQRDGLTAQQLAPLAGLNAADTRRCLKAMPDAYVDRWIKGKRGQYEKVWMAVYVPPNCPHPKDRPYKFVPPRTVWRHVGATA